MGYSFQRFCSVENEKLLLTDFEFYFFYATHLIWCIAFSDFKPRVDKKFCNNFYFFVTRLLQKKVALKALWGIASRDFNKKALLQSCYSPKPYGV